jgi:hypothetical protein
MLFLGNLFLQHLVVRKPNKNGPFSRQIPLPPSPYIEAVAIISLQEYCPCFSPCSKVKTTTEKMAYANPKIPRARRKHVRCLIDALEAECGGKFTPAQRELAQRCAFTSLAIEDYEMKLLANEVVDPLVLTTLGAQQRRLLAALGLHRDPPQPPEPPSPEDEIVARYAALSQSGKVAA